MEMSLVAGTAAMHLTRAVATALAIEPTSRTIERFPDGEIHVRIEQSVRGSDVFIVQSLSPPAESHLLELLFLADACRRAGAERITAVVPYFAYARQDRQSMAGEAVGARIVADTLATSGVDRAVMVDVHVAAIQSICSVPVEHLTAAPVLAGAIRPFVPEPAVIVAPDTRALRLAGDYARLLQLPVAAIHKLRLTGADVKALTVAGKVAGHHPVIVDDIISTGRTIKAAADALIEAGCVPRFLIAATHGLFVGDAIATLASIDVQRLLITDTVPQREDARLPRTVVSAGPLLAETISQLHGPSRAA
jgi:ribose-phosphate pyrophosphokinase